MDLVGPITEMLNCLMPPVCRHLEHHRNLHQNMEEIRRRLGDLNSLKEDIESRKQIAEDSSTKAVRREVERWLVNVQTINNEIQVVEQKFQNVSCLCHGSLGKRVQKKIEEVNKLLQQGSFPEDIVIDKPPSNGMTLPTEDVRGRTNVKEQIWAYLMEDDVGMIGVCGLGGIGKTTLMKKIHNDLLNDSKFDKVIWAPLPHPVSVVKLQDNIARNMKQTLPENVTEEQRAAILSKILSRVRYVLILDDAWGRFSLEDVGIPKPTQQNGCKIVITSRSVELCNYIGCDQVIRMQQLSEEESLNLFLDTVGHDVLMKIPNLEETLKLVVAECAGLPLAIVVIAKSMRGENDISTWRYVLFELRSRVKRVKGWDNEIFERLKFSYDRLNDAELQNCFLYCSLFCKDLNIQRLKLIEDWIDNGLIEQLETRKLMRDRANVILISLINKCLIERVEFGSDNGIRMHDVMRDMALQVAGPRFMAKGWLQVTELPGVNEWTENLEKASLRNNNMIDIASNMSPNCPKLSSLDISGNYDLRQLPYSFFVHMIGLKFLNLSGADIQALPDSISILENLTILRLDYYRKLRYMPSLAKLKALKKLDLKKAGIEKVPQGMEMLVNLQHLNLDCPNLVELPMGILCNLTHLQFLAVDWKHASFATKADKVIRLKILETFVGKFDDLQGLNGFVKSFHQDQKFTRYWLRIGVTDGIPFPGFSVGTGYNLGNMMTLDEFEMGKNYIELLMGIECTKIIVFIGVKIEREYSMLLLNDFQFLKIRNCSGVKSLSEISLFKTAKDLRCCEMDGCEGVECVLDLFLSTLVRRPFDKLESLKLYDMPDLRVLVKVETQIASAPSTSQAPAFSSIFPNLKIVKISRCPRIKKLFPSELLTVLQNLEEIDVLDCPKMEEIIEVDEEKETIRKVGNNETITIALPKLRKLRLSGLPKLKSICTVRGVMVCDSIQTIEIHGCPILNGIPLYLPLLPNGELSPPPSLQEIDIESTERWELLVWENPLQKDVLLPFLKPGEIFPSLSRKFYNLQDFNNYVKSFQGEKLGRYELCVEATDDDDNYFGFDSDFNDDCTKMVTFSGMEISGDYSVLLPTDLQFLIVTKCSSMKSLNEVVLFKALTDLRLCEIKQCDELECVFELFSLSSVCNPFHELSIRLIELPNLNGLVKMKGQAASAPSTVCAPTQPSIFSNLKILLIYKCSRIKILFPSELLKGLHNLKEICVIDCTKMEEIVEVEEEKETLMTDEENETIAFILPKLTELVLWGLPKLKSICTARGVMVCDSLQKIEIGECPKLRRIPLYLAPASQWRALSASFTPRYLHSVRRMVGITSVGQSFH